MTRNELADLKDRLVEVTDAMRDAADALDDRIAPSKVLARLLEQLESTLGVN